MTSSDRSDFNLSNLPSDVIRNIINVQQESINEMMLISRRWNSLALAYLSDRRRLPIIDWFEWNIDNTGKSTLGIQIADIYRKYFGVVNWKISNDSADVDTDCCHLFKKIRNRGKNLAVLLTRLFNRCSHIKKLSLKFNIVSRESEIAVIIDALGDVGVDQLACTALRFLDKGLQTILNIALTLRARRLHLNSAETVDFLPENLYNEPLRGFFAAAALGTTQIRLETVVWGGIARAEWKQAAGILEARIPQCTATANTDGLFPGRIGTLSIDIDFSINAGGSTPDPAKAE